MFIPIIQAAVSAMSSAYARRQELQRQYADFRMQRILDTSAAADCTLADASVAVDVADALTGVASKP